MKVAGCELLTSCKICSHTSSRFINPRNKIGLLLLRLNSNEVPDPGRLELLILFIEIISVSFITTFDSPTNNFKDPKLSKHI